MSEYKLKINQYIDLSGKLSASYNLNNGLPWTNPLKIGIGSDQHILDTTINRGLMMLLNNDYFLDAKTSLMSEQVSGLFYNTNLIHSVLKQHINDQSVHGTSKITYNYYITSGNADTSGSLTYNNSIATKDYMVYLPISMSVNEINQKIAAIPHTLNGHNIVFMFVIPIGFQPVKEQRHKTSIDTYSMNVGNGCISFSNFVNGTIFVIGDFLHETKINGQVNFEKFTQKTENQINDPEKYDGIILSKFISKLYKEIDNPESSYDIQKYYSQQSQVGVKDLNKIIIKGSGLNSNYSIMNFNDITARVYVKNLLFQSTLQSIISNGKNTNIINLSDALNLDVPTTDKFLIHWPLNQYSQSLIEQKLTPTVGTELIEYMQKQHNTPTYDNFKNYLNYISGGIEIISGYFKIDNSKIENQKFKYVISNDLTGAISAKILSSCYNQFKDEFHLDEEKNKSLTGTINLSSSILNKVIDSVDKELIPELTGKILTNSINQVFSQVKKIELSIPSFIINPSGTYDNDLTTSEIMLFKTNLQSFEDQLSSLINSTEFKEFLKVRPDIYYDNYDLVTSDEDQIVNKFIMKYNMDGLFSSFDLLNNKINTNVLGLLLTIQEQTLQNNLTLTSYGSGLVLNNIIPNELSPCSSDVDIQTNYANHSVDAILLKEDITKSLLYSGYFALQTNDKQNPYINFLGKLLFGQDLTKWNQLKQKGTPFQKNTSTSVFTSSPLFDSTYDSTITFWTKFDEKTICAPFLSFYQGNDFKFAINFNSIMSIFRGDSTDTRWGTQITSGDLLVANLNTDQIKEILNYGSRKNIENTYYPWLFWSLKIDKASSVLYDPEYLQQSVTPDFRNSFSVHITAYKFLKNNGILTVKKYQLNEIPFVENKNVQEYFIKDYVYKPFFNSQFSNFNIKIGGLRYQNSNQETNKNFYNGYFRNLMIFKGHLTQLQEKNLFKLGIINQYQFPSEYENDLLYNLIQSKKFFIGLVSIYDSSDINIINCDTKYDGTSYIVQ